ncbi:MAG TPA: Glu/Leu/Phe/Val dehydrogenase [Gammaproteobacteria bacterium]|jgi:glutamate dehydrogenase (NAD(P)+)
MTENTFRFCDELGPKSILHIYDPRIDLRAILVVDNVAAGPSIGGVRLAPDVSLDECFRLARAMTMKNAAAGLAHGGGKAVIFGDPAMDVTEKEQVIRGFASAVRHVVDFIPGPDMGTNELAMAWVRDEIGRSVGLPRELGGIPLDEIGATGFGLAVAAEIAASEAGIELEGARIAVQGFGSVGTHAARRLIERGAKLVAVADSRDTVADPAGLDAEALIALKTEGRHVVDLDAGHKLAREAIIGVDCDILIPAARPDAVNAGNAEMVKARMIIQGANIGVTEAAESILRERGVVCPPDFISNAGGVICAAVEYHEGTESQAFATIEEKISANMNEVLDRARRTGCSYREAAVTMATDRVRAAMRTRRWA